MVMDEIVLGGGCFWCVEAALETVEGVESVVSGYAGGSTDKPTYEQVCSGGTGHAEVVKVVFDEEIVSLESLLESFFKIHEPTTEDREGADIGSQYRSIILYESEDQKSVVRDFLEKKSEEFEDDIVTEVKILKEFYRAEDRHQDYFEKNPDSAYCRANIPSKIDKLEQED